MRKSDPVSDQLVALESGQIDPAAFPHAEHLRLGYEMLARFPFADALARFSKGLRLLAAKGGRPQVYNDTITVAFLALISERRARKSYNDWEKFIADNTDLCDKSCLQRWYDSSELSSEVARQTFVLPKPARSVSSSESQNASLPLVGHVAGLRAGRLWYGAIFSAYILWSSSLAIIENGQDRAVQCLALAEINGALLFLFRSTRAVGLVLLVIVFAIAASAELITGQLPARFIFYAASAWFAFQATRINSAPA
jgi:hypothetical protein